MSSEIFRIVRSPVVLATFAFFTSVAGTPAQTVPIYQVTVVERTVKAVNYQYHNGPTRIDFRGTVLMPPANGEAVVESKAGRTVIDAKLSHINSPTRYGGGYLTYVLWAITPEGHAKNLGEVLTDASDRAKLSVTTDLQAFGLIVTAEPYAAVRQPSDVVVVENEVRPDTIGHVEPILAKAELLPRGHYTYHIASQASAAETNGVKVTMDRYESMLEVYEAQNAVQIARAQGADRYAPDTFARAEEMLRNAQRFDAQKADRKTVVTEARHAAQTAEDARILAEQRKRDQELVDARAAAQHEQELRIRAEADAQRARTTADHVQSEPEPITRTQPEIEIAVRPEPVSAKAQVTVSQPITAVEESPSSEPIHADKAGLRVQLLGQLNAAMLTRDTPRGLVATLGDADFRGPTLRPEIYRNLARIASAIVAHPGLMVLVEGNCDSPSGGHEADERAAAVHDALVVAGVPSVRVTARNLGDTRPVVSNASATGRLQNRRVEVTISGEPIGTVASWDRRYSLLPK
jgi:outer membrane protein OmpA-like peptidoglycan-associated protein